MIFKYLEYPTEEEWNEIITRNDTILNLNINFKIPDTIPAGTVLKEWILLFNYRLDELHMTYVFLMHYYNKGILDHEWYISPGRNEGSKQYLPRFENEYISYKIMFDYYADIFYYKMFSAWELILHLINIYYRLDVAPGIGYSQRVMNKLKIKNKHLTVFINERQNSAAMKRALMLKDRLAHNFSNDDLKEAITRDITSQGAANDSSRIKGYISAKELVNSIHELIDLFFYTKKELERSFKQDTNIME